MPKKKYIKKPFPRKGVDWKKIKREKEKTKESLNICKIQATYLAQCAESLIKPKKIL
tara:strand:+ start:453 stop:623 length:171 start_codon:yes stop_codon:yes gene_type:complete